MQGYCGVETKCLVPREVASGEITGFSEAPDIPSRCIKAGCKPGGTVLDPFCGTGTTGLAALAIGQRFVPRTA
jgi:hypothetical protein